MARIRTIKPEFWDSPDTAKASLRARLFYIAMWNWADDYGKGTASAKQLIGFAFPNDDDIAVSDYPSLAKDVAECFGVVFYEADRRPYYFIPTFPEHQRTEKRAVSRIPDPPHDITAGQTPWGGESDGSSDTSDGSTVSGTGEQGKGNRGTGEQGKELSRKNRASDPDFDAFWDAYGKKLDRAKAERAFKSAKKKANPLVIINAAGEHARWHQRAGTETRFIKHAASWLNAEGWLDERPEPLPPQGASKPSTTDQRVRDGMALAQRLREREENETPRAIGQNS